MGEHHLACLVPRQKQSKPISASLIKSGLPAYSICTSSATADVFVIICKSTVFYCTVKGKFYCMAIMASSQRGNHCLQTTAHGKLNINLKYMLLHNGILTDVFM